MFMSQLHSFRLLALATVLLSGKASIADPVNTNNVKVSISGGSFSCRVVTVDIKHGGLIPKLVFARDGIGRTEQFASMLQRSHAVCGINGSFFDAYNTVGDKDPGMTLITGGSVVHKGGTGTVCGFSTNGDVVIGKLDLPIKGRVTFPGHRPTPWYAYWLNRTPTSADNIAVFTPARGERARVSDGMTVVVRHNEVVKVVQGDAAIPKDGFVINFRGDSGPQTALFPLGAIVTFTVARKSERNEDAWQDVQEAVGAGPNLVTDGEVKYNPESEGFSSPKILSLGGLRSAIGVSRDGKVLLVTASGPTVAQLAQVMLKLGAVHAMNLDGGASSGLYCNGNMLTTPGRELSNALVFVKK
jgi:hypothetical protein